MRLLILAASFLTYLTMGGAHAQRPNIVLILADDWSWPHASILGDQTVQTPTFDRIAREGALFENAFVTAPSCTSSRFAILSGQHHWRLEEGENLGGSLKADVPLYTDLLQEQGYQVGYARKGATPSKNKYRETDPCGQKFANFDAFADQLDASEPFCFWYGAGEPHRPYDWQASEKQLNLDKIQIPFGLPNVREVRTDLGDYYLRVQKMDRLASDIIKRLEKMDVLEDTIVIMTSDNGMPFPRCKATLYDAGVRVPLAIRWGARIKPGRSVSEFVSLVDLAPTLLEATEQPAVEQMTGRSLMKQLTSTEPSQIDDDRSFVLTGRERHVYPWPARAIRTSRFLYIRNFAPASWPTGLTEPPQAEEKYDFTDTPWPTDPPAFSFNVDPSPTKQWIRLNSAPGFGLEVPPNEELYDLETDPDQLVNVAQRAEFAETRARLASKLSNELRRTEDPRFELEHFATYSIHGWQVHLNEQLWVERAQDTQTTLDLLSEQLARIVAVVPQGPLQKLRQVPIWINPEYEATRPRAEYHPNAGWLRANGREPAMEKCVEISNVSIFDRENIRMPMLMLHELAHAYHDRVLGWERKDILDAFERAVASGIYDEVDRFTGRGIIKDRAYALSNHKEYFAESTEAYFGKNDFFPFTNEELLAVDPHMHQLLKKIWIEEP